MVFRGLVENTGPWCTSANRAHLFLDSRTKPSRVTAHGKCKASSRCQHAPFKIKANCFYLESWGTNLLFLWERSAPRGGEGPCQEQMGFSRLSASHGSAGPQHRESITAPNLG